MEFKKGIFFKENPPESTSGHQIPRQELRGMMLAAWKSIATDFLGRLVESMSARCQSVVDADGGHILYRFL